MTAGEGVLPSWDGNIRPGSSGPAAAVRHRPWTADAGRQPPVHGRCPSGHRGAMSKTAPGAFFALQRATCPPTPQDRPASRRGGGSKARWQFAASGLFIWPFRVIAEQAVGPGGRRRGDAWSPPPAAAPRRRVRLPPCNGPCSMGLSAFRSRRACTRGDERTTRIILVKAAPSRPSPCVARWRCRRPSQRPVPVSDRWLTGAVPASPMAPICPSTCIARPRSRTAPMRGGRRRGAGRPSGTARRSHGGRAWPCRRLNAGVVKAW